MFTLITSRVRLCIFPKVMVFMRHSFVGTGKLKDLYASTTMAGAASTPCMSAISKASGAAADILLNDGDTLLFGNRFLRVLATPGHTEVGVKEFLLFSFIMSYIHTETCISTL